MTPALKAALHEELGSEVTHARPVGGGCINDASACTLADDREVFVKTHASAGAEMFLCEARGLRWLAEADALRVPEVLAVSPAGSTPAYLALEFLPESRRGKGFDSRFGRGLAQLHAYGAAHFGFEEDNFLATLPQENAPRKTWSDFYAEARLLPLVARAVDSGTAPGDWSRRFETLCSRLDELAGPEEPPARLHGDLWSGNVHCSGGEPVLIDPAVYGGHREIDLAMLQLFGSPGTEFFSAYDETYPRAPGHEERLPLYQLYPLLAHVNLFGGSYVGSVERALRALS